MIEAILGIFSLSVTLAILNLTWEIRKISSVFKDWMNIITKEIE